MKINKEKIFTWLLCGLMAYVCFICGSAIPIAISFKQYITTLQKATISQYELINRLQDKQFALSDSIFQYRLDIMQLNHKVDSLSQRLIDFDNELTEIFD